MQFTVTPQKVSIKISTLYITAAWQEPVKRKINFNLFIFYTTTYTEIIGHAVRLCQLLSEDDISFLHTQ